MASNLPIRTQFHVNASAMTAGASRIGSILQREGYRIETGLRIIAEDLIQDVMEDAMAVADDQEGFPDKYKRHVRRVLRSLPIYTSVDAAGVNVRLDLYDLGGVDDLRRAFHQGARLADGGKLDGPYEGQALANEDAGQRHIFWEALRRGDRNYQNPKGFGMVPIPDEASWEATMDKYIEIWGNQAPEWLFIQFGQNEWEPYVPEYDILGDFAERLQIEAAAYLSTVVTEEVRIANEYQSAGIAVGFTSRGSVRNLATGRFVKKNLGG